MKETIADMISIIVPVYNDREGLKRCMDALSSQTIDPQQFEVIVVDNGSECSPEAIVGNYAFAKLFVENTPGSYAARNKGVSKAKGEYLAFLDADCIPENDWLEQGIKELKRSAPNTIIGGDVKLIQSRMPGTVELYQCLVGFQQKEHIQQRKFTSTADLFIRHTGYFEIGPFEERLLSGGDANWSWRAIKLGFTIKYCPVAIVETLPRKTLRAAILQARRITGGRFQIEQLGHKSNSFDTQYLSLRRNSWQSFVWICKHPDLSLVNRARVLYVAIILKLVQIIERWRLKYGAAAERC